MAIIYLFGLVLSMVGYFFSLVHIAAWAGDVSWALLFALGFGLGMPLFLSLMKLDWLRYQARTEALHRQRLAQESRHRPSLALRKARLGSRAAAPREPALR